MRRSERPDRHRYGPFGRPPRQRVAPSGEEKAMTMETDGTQESEAGMTLIEILMGVVLSGIMIAALVGGIMAYMRGAAATTYLLKETPELQLVATTFGTDVQSAETVTKPATGATPACGTAGDTTIVDFRWNDYS